MPAGWVAAGAAVVGGIESMSANASAGKANAINNQNAEQMNAAEQNAFKDAESIEKTPFTPYTGQFAAGLTPNEIQAGEQASSAAAAGNAAATDFAKAGQQIDYEAGNGFSGENVNKYMDPYVGDVVNNEIEQANKSYQESEARNAESTANSGAFGTDRAALQQSELEGENQLNIGQLTATGYSNAYQSAIDAWKADNQRAQAAAEAYQQNGGDITRMNSAQIADLMRTGGAAQAVEQTNLNAQYQEFLRGQNWNAQELQPLISAIGASRGTNVTPAIQSNAANTILGVASTVAGLAGGGAGGAGGGLDTNPDTNGTNATLQGFNAAQPTPTL